MSTIKGLRKDTKPLFFRKILMSGLDSFFFIGDSHEICEDYAVSGIHHLNEAETNIVPYGIVGDGCSAAKNVDFGSRFLVKAAENNIQHFFSNFDSFPSIVLQEALLYARICILIAFTRHLWYY